MDLALALPTRRSTERLGRALGGSLEGGALVLLDGDLGAGKTFLARAVCRALGVGREERVTSPTFTLVHAFEGKVPILHADLYRLEGPGELAELGLREARASGAVLLVEWGLSYEAALGGDSLVVALALAEPGRRARITATGPASEGALARLRERLGTP